MVYKWEQSLTAASTFAGDSSFGLDSIDIILKTMLSTYTSNNGASLIFTQSPRKRKSLHASLMLSLPGSSTKKINEY